MKSSYEEEYRARLDSLRPGLSDQLGLVPTLTAEQAHQVVSYLLGLACQATNDTSIRLGRGGIAGIPADWLVHRIEQIAEEHLDLSDDWQFTRLLELYALLDKRAGSLNRGMLARLVARGLGSPNPEIVEAAADFLPRSFEPGGLVDVEGEPIEELSLCE
jgi:hypothetical protein